MSDLTIYQAMALLPEHAKAVSPRLKHIPDPPPWRVFTREGLQQRGSCFYTDDESKRRITEVVNAALCLRRPILVEGGPGTGKTTLAYSIALELGLPGPYRWSITSRSTLRDGLYEYDAVGRLHAATLAKQNNDKDTTRTGQFLRLGPVGMAFHKSEPAAGETPSQPAVLLIDEIDKSDIDLPNDLLHIFEEGAFEIPELQRLAGDGEEEVLPWRQSEEGDPPRIKKGEVRCREFPIVIMTSNGEREFPGPFLRRCLRLKLEVPTETEALLKLVEQRFGKALEAQKPAVKEVIRQYLKNVKDGKRHSVDQLLNAMQLLLRGTDISAEQGQRLREVIFANLTD